MTTTRVKPPDFDRLNRQDADPWRVTTSAYERRKNAVLLASLPSERYVTVWEPGCGVGALSRELAGRADHLIASDASEVAVRLTSERCADLPQVTVHHSGLPDSPLSQPVDLVVAAEFLYYLPDLPGSLDVLWQQLRPGGHLATVHWRHDAEDLTRSGAALHVDLAADATDRGARHLVHHDDEHFVIDVFGTDA